MPVPKLSADRRYHATFVKADHEDFAAFLQRVEEFEPLGWHTEWHFLDAEGNEPSVTTDPEAIVRIVRSWQPPVCAVCHCENSSANPLASYPAIVASNQRREVLCNDCAPRDYSDAIRVAYLVVDIVESDLNGSRYDEVPTIAIQAPNFTFMLTWKDAEALANALTTIVDIAERG